MIIKLLEQYYVVTIDEAAYNGFINKDDKVSDLKQALKFKTIEEATKYRDWIRETYVGAVDVAETNTIVKILK
jgi:hypothetical protein